MILSKRTYVCMHGALERARREQGDTRRWRAPVFWVLGLGLRLGLIDKFPTKTGKKKRWLLRMEGFHRQVYRDRNAWLQQQHGRLTGENGGNGQIGYRLCGC